MVVLGCAIILMFMMFNADSGSETIAWFFIIFNGLQGNFSLIHFARVRYDFDLSVIFKVFGYFYSTLSSKTMFCLFWYARNEFKNRNYERSHHFQQTQVQLGLTHLLAVKTPMKISFRRGSHTLQTTKLRDLLKSVFINACKLKLHTVLAIWTRISIDIKHSNTEYHHRTKQNLQITKSLPPMPTQQRPSPNIRRQVQFEPKP